jgi:tetratricopeptide (TPR) repeat protein
MKLRYIFLCFIVVFISNINVNAQEKSTPPAAETPKKAGGEKKQEGPKPKTPNEIARELLASGESNKKLGRHDQAIKDFDLAIETDPTLYEVYVGRASTLFLKLDFQSAMLDYNRAIEIIETESEKIKTQAKIKRVLQDLPGEKLELDKLEKLKPILAEAYYQRGNLKKFMDDKDSCCEDLKKARDLGHLQGEQTLREYCN